MKEKIVSIIIPLLNEEAVIPHLIKSLTDILESLENYNYQLVFVDDGSTDRTASLIKETAKMDPRLTLVSLSRNFGHQIAFSAGLDWATGDLVILMDGDLQDDPGTIKELIKKNEEGFDVVYVVRRTRQSALWLKLSYYLFYRILNLFSNFQIPNDSGDFALLSRKSVDALRAMPERHRFLRGMRAWTGFNQTGIEVDRARRLHGSSKYNLKKLFRLAFDGLFSFSVSPLRIATVCGVFSIFCCAAMAIYWLVVRFFYESVPSGFAAGVAVVVFIGGVQFLLLGIIGEYIARIYEEAKQRPLYIVKEVYNQGSSKLDESS